MFKSSSVNRFYFKTYFLLSEFACIHREYFDVFPSEPQCFSSHHCTRSCSYSIYVAVSRPTFAFSMASSKQRESVCVRIKNRRHVFSYDVLDHYIQLRDTHILKDSCMYILIIASIL